MKRAVAIFLTALAFCVTTPAALTAVGCAAFQTVQPKLQPAEQCLLSQILPGLLAGLPVVAIVDGALGCAGVTYEDIIAAIDAMEGTPADAGPANETSLADAAFSLKTPDPYGAVLFDRMEAVREEVLRRQGVTLTHRHALDAKAQ